MAVARLRAVPTLPAGLDPALRRVLDAIIEQLAAARGERGSDSAAYAELSTSIRVLQQRVADLESAAAAAALAAKISGYVSMAEDADVAALAGGEGRYGSVASTAAGDVGALAGTVT